MKIDFTAYQLFLGFLENQAPLSAALAHPAYRVVFEHARRYGPGLFEADVRRALGESSSGESSPGEPSPFYGLGGVRDHLQSIQALAATLRQNQAAWLALIEAEFARLLPAADLSGVVVYPILGYDMGIGLNEAVCMNLNFSRYLADPWEFFYYMIHETAHVLYQQCHAIPELAQVTTPADWWAYFGLWLQNEGFAVFSALRLRQERGHLAERDYQVLSDPALLAASLALYHDTRRLLRSGQPLKTEDYWERIYGDHRILYRAGCAIFQEILRRGGPEAVRRAFYTTGKAFLEEYGALV